MQLNERATITLVIEGDEARNELSKLEVEAKQLERALKEAPKGTQEWADLYRELGKNQDAQKKLREEVGLTGLTMKQLQDESKKLSKELANLTPDTEEFINKSKQLNDVKARLAEVKMSAAGVGDALDDKMANPTLWGKITNGINLVKTAFQAFIVLQVVQYLVQGFTAIISKFSEFEDAAQELSAITGLTGKDLEYLKDQAKQTGPQFGMTAAEMLNAYKLMGSAKPELLAQKEALADVTKEAIILSKAGKIDLADAAKVTAESLNQFGAKADQARRFVNVMAAGAKEGAAEISEMSSSLKASGTVASSAKLSFEQTNAVLQSMSTIALKGEQSGTQLRNILIKLQTGAKDTNPAIVGLDKALENLGNQNLSTAELAKRFGTENVVGAQHVITHRKEIAELTAKMTGTSTAYEQAATNMNTLSETWNRGTAIVTGFAVSIGEKLAPYVKTALDYLLEMADNTDVASGVFTTFGGIFSDIISIFKSAINLIFPNFNAGALTIRGVMQGVAVVFETILVPVRLFTASLAALLEAFQAVGTGAKGLVLFLQGDFAGAGKAFEETKQHGINIKDTFNKAFTDIGDGYKKAFADKPKEVLPAAVESNKTTQGAIQDAITDEANKGNDKRDKDAEKARKKQETDHQKHLEDVKKANGKALDDLSKMEQERQENSIKDELERDLLKMRHKRNDELRANEESIADTNLKEEKKKAIFQKYTDEEGKIRDTHREKQLKADEEELKRKEEAAQKRLEITRNISKLEQDAEMALLDWKELQAQGNATKLLAIAKERAETSIRITISRLNDEEKEEKAKAEREIKDDDLKAQTLKAIGDKYNGIRKIETAKTVAEIEKIEQEHLEKKKEFWGNASSAFSSLLKGDLDAFAEHSAKMFQGEQQGWQKKLEGNLATYQAIGEMATEAANFLANLAKKRADKAIAEAQRERDEKINALEQELDKATADITAFDEKKKQIEQDTSTKIEEIKSTSQKRVADLEKFYSDKANALGSADLQAEIDRTKQEAETKIAEATRIFNEEKARAEATRSAKISEAQTTRDAEIAAINARADVAQADKAAMIAAATAKANEAIRLANEEANKQIELSNQTKTQKITDATNETTEKKRLLSEYAAANDATTQQAIADAKNEATNKISEAQRNRDAQIAAANEERDKKVAAAEDLRDKDIAAVIKRSDISLRERDRLIAAAKAKAELEIKLATDEAETKMKLSKDEADAKIKDATLEQETKIDLLKELATADKDRAKELIQQSKDEAEAKIKTAEDEKTKKLQLLADEKTKRISEKKELEASIEDEDRKARVTQANEKSKAWKAQQKADIASALIAGALATIKALASGFFPVNLVFAAATAVATGIQVAMIKKQQPPEFRDGGIVPAPGYSDGGANPGNLPGWFQRKYAKGGTGYVKNAGVLAGSRHGRIYGDGGIRMIDNRTGHDVGEAEGGEPFMILSRNTYANNKPVIDNLLYSSLYRNGAKIAYRDGGLGWAGPGRSGRSLRMFEDGGIVDAGGSSDGGQGVNEAEARAAGEEAKKQGEAQLKFLEEIRDAVKDSDRHQIDALSDLNSQLSTAMDNLASKMDGSITSMAQKTEGAINSMADQVKGLNGSIMEVKGAADNVAGKTNEVKDAVYATNQAGRLDAIISALSKFG